MVLEKQANTHAAFFLSGIQNEGDSALGLPAEGSESARGFENGHRARSVIDGTLAEVPRIEMAADDDALVGMFAAFDFGDGDGSGNRSWTESAFQIDFHGDRACLREAIEQAVIFVSDKCRRDRGRLVGVQ